MKVEYTEDGLRVFLQNIYFNDVDLEDKDNIVSKLNYIFDFITDVYHYSIKGLYRVKVYPTRICFIIDLVLLDKDTYSGNDFEFKILVILNKKIYFKTEEFSLVKDMDYYYNDGFYYVNLDKISDFNSYSEFGNIILGDEEK